MMELSSLKNLFWQFIVKETLLFVTIILASMYVYAFLTFQTKLNWHHGVSTIMLNNLRFSTFIRDLFSNS